MHEIIYIYYIYIGVTFFFSPRNRYRLGHAFFFVCCRFFVVQPFWTKRATLSLPPPFGSVFFQCRVPQPIPVVFFSGVFKNCSVRCAAARLTARALVSPPSPACSCETGSPRTAQPHA